MNRSTFIRWAIYIIVGFVAVLANTGVIRFDLRSRADEIPADIHINTKAAGAPIPKDFYHAFAQGGEEQKDMIAPVLSQVKQLKPAVIRIDHIYDNFSVVSRVNGSLQFDFSGLDAAVATIRQTGAIPFLSLSYMPAAIAKDGIITNPPVNWSEWALVVQKTVEHFSATIPGMYYEVWNEPDLPQFGGWKPYGTKNYLTLYHYAAVGAANATRVLPFSFGGPATTALYKSWVTPLISSGERVDFISWHSYNGDAAKIAENLKTYSTWSTYPALITEFGFTGAHDPKYATPYAAAFTAATVRHLLSAPPTFLFSFELKDGPVGKDGWGMITHESLGATLKPRYSVFSLLDMMNGNRLTLTGENPRVSGWAASDSGIIKAMLVNYFPDRERSVTVPVTFEGLVPGNYSLRQKYLSGTDTTVNVVVPTTTLAKTVYLPADGVLYLELKSL